MATMSLDSTNASGSGPAEGGKGDLATRGNSAEHAARERRRAIARFTRRGLVAAAIAAGAGGAVLALRPRPVPVDVARVRRGPLSVEIVESGKTRVKDRYVVSAPVGGSLSRLRLNPGDIVKEGDTLAEVAPTLSPLLDARARAEGDARLGAALAALERAHTQTSRATAAKDLADRDLTRLHQLAKTGAIAREPLEQGQFEARFRAEELASAVFASKVAAEEVRLARATLGGDGGSRRDRHVDIVAPGSGRALGVRQKSESVVAPGTPIVEVGDPTALEVVVDLLTTDAVHVHPGTRALIQGWGGETALEGRVRLVEPSAFTRPSALGVDEQRVNVVVTLTDPGEKWAALGDGYRVEARFVLWHSDDVVKVPQGAVFRHEDHWAAFDVRARVASLVAVEVGHRGETEVEILKGLPAGATVTVHPGDRVHDGVRVEPR